MPDTVHDLDAVRDFWDEASCGEELLLPSKDRDGYAAQSAERYRLEPYIEELARFDDARGKQVLEIGVGLGADHQRFAEAGAKLHGIDLTPRAIEHTRRRLELFGLKSDLRVGNAEALPFADSTFDLVYSWGVIHHSPDTAKAAREILRVLKPGGRFAVMIYYRYSLIGLMLWLRYGPKSLDKVYAEHLESPGTKAYSLDGARRLFEGADNVRAWTVLTHGDLLESGAGQRHQGRLLDLARKVWPRWLLRRVAKRNGQLHVFAGERKVTRPGRPGGLRQTLKTKYSPRADRRVRIIQGNPRYGQPCLRNINFDPCIGGALIRSAFELRSSSRGSRKRRLPFARCRALGQYYRASGKPPLSTRPSQAQSLPD